MDLLQARMTAWYAQFKRNKKTSLLKQLQLAFNKHELRNNRPSTDAADGSGTNPLFEHVRVGEAIEEVRILRDLTFPDIPKDGLYTTALQRLLAQLIKLEAKVRVLEQEIASCKLQ